MIGFYLLVSVYDVLVRINNLGQIDPIFSSQYSVFLGLELAICDGYFIETTPESVFRLDIIPILLLALRSPANKRVMFHRYTFRVQRARIKPKLFNYSFLQMFALAPNASVF